MNLRELLEAVKEKHLSKDQLENYRDELSNLFAQIHLEMAELEKEEALYFLKYKQAENGVRADIVIKRMWRGTKEGQRLIELSHHAKGTEKILSSLKSRLYQVY